MWNSDSRVVADVGQQPRRSSPGSGVDRSMWQRQTQPSAFSGTSACSAAGCGSWTSATSHPPGSSRGVHLVVPLPVVPLLGGEVLRRALQRVVHQLGRVEELLAPVDDLPLDVEADVLHQRDQRVEDLATPPPNAVADMCTTRAPRSGSASVADLLDQVPADDVGVVGEGLGPEGRRAGARERALLSHAGDWSGRVPSVTRHRPARLRRGRPSASTVVARRLALQRSRQVGVAARTARAVDLGDDVAARAPRLLLEASRARVAGPQAGLVGRAAGDDLLDPRAVVGPAGRSASASCG